MNVIPWNVWVVGLGTTVCVSISPGCAILQRPVELPTDDGPVVMVMSGALGQPLSDVARHPWIAMREEVGSNWIRYEVMCCEPNTVERHIHDPLDDYGAGGGDVQVHGVIRGEEARDAIACIEREAKRYPYDDYYLVWPGPNSNTFVDYMIRTCDLDTELPATAIGRDYRGPVGVSTTAGGTGVQFESPVVGLKVGLTEGVELHIFTLAIGVDLWPPAIILPVGDGRLGFADR
ncbi:MAG: DUF3750 domain-containing protein [Myxococcota bacterium]